MSNSNKAEEIAIEAIKDMHHPDKWIKQFCMSSSYHHEIFKLLDSLPDTVHLSFMTILKSAYVTGYAAGSEAALKIAEISFAKTNNHTVH